MRRNHEIPTGLKVGVGIGVVYLLYRLLGTGGGRGPGPGAGTRRGAGRGLSAMPSVPGVTVVPTPAPTPLPVIAPARPRDEQPVEIRVRPSPTDPHEAVIEMEGRIVSLGELIARIDAGRRRDVLVRVRGDTRHGAWTEIRDTLVFMGIQVSVREPVVSPSPRS